MWWRRNTAGQNRPRLNHSWKWRCTGMSHIPSQDGNCVLWTTFIGRLMPATSPPFHLKIRHGLLAVVDAPLFPPYLFIRIGQSDAAKTWALIRSTRGVSRLVRFGRGTGSGRRWPDRSIGHAGGIGQGRSRTAFQPGERLWLTEAPFTGIEGIYQMADGGRRVMVLIEVLSRLVAMRVEPGSLRKLG